MAGVQQTSVQAEGSDPLQSFFNQNSKLKPQWLDKIREELDYDDLLESDAADLRNVLKNDCELKDLAVTKILNAVRKVPESVMYQAHHGTKVSIVSMEEHEAAQKIEKESARINEAIVNTVNIMEKLNENSKTTSKTLNDTFDQIVEKANKRRDFLLARLKQITSHKHNQLSVQKEAFNQKMKELNDAYAETQTMMKDITVNPLKRNTKILSKSKQLLDQKMTLNPATNDHIVVHLDVESVNNAISKLGAIQDGFGALPPTVTVGKIASGSAKVMIKKKIQMKKSAMDMNCNTWMLVRMLMRKRNWTGNASQYKIIMSLLSMRLLLYTHPHDIWFEQNQKITLHLECIRNVFRL
eukprot:1051087_1